MPGESESPAPARACRLAGGRALSAEGSRHAGEARGSVGEKLEAVACVAPFQELRLEGYQARRAADESILHALLFERNRALIPRAEARKD